MRFLYLFLNNCTNIKLADDYAFDTHQPDTLTQILKNGLVYNLKQVALMLALQYR